MTDDSQPLSVIWSRLSGVGVGVTDATFMQFLDQTFPHISKQWTDEIQVYFASNEPIELRILKKVDPNLQTYLSIGDVLYQQDPNVDKLKTLNKRTQRAFNAAVMNFIPKDKGGKGQTGGKFAYMEVGDDMTKLIFHEKGAPIVAFIKEIRAVYRRLNRQEPAVIVIGGNNIPFRKIKQIPFTPPSKVWDTWKQQIEPQLDSKKVYNHVLFYGDPGSGKTAFCRWVATQYPKWKFVFAPPQTFMESGRLSGLFREARTYSPSVIVFEDIDLVGRHRGDMGEGFSPLLGELLNQLDGVEPSEKVLCIASTNNPKGLDPAVRRHGRFGIKMDLLYTPEEKLKILKSYYAVPLSDEELMPHLSKVQTPVNLKMIAKLSEVYRDHLHYKFTEGIFSKIVDEILSDKPAKVLEGEEDNNYFPTTSETEDNNTDDPLVK